MDENDEDTYDPQYVYDGNIIAYSNRLSDLKQLSDLGMYAHFTTISGNYDTTIGETGPVLYLLTNASTELTVMGHVNLILKDGTSIPITDLNNITSSGCNYWNKTLNLLGKEYYLNTDTDRNTWKYTDIPCKYKFNSDFGYSGNGYYWGNYNIFGYTAGSISDYVQCDHPLDAACVITNNERVEDENGKSPNLLPRNNSFSVTMRYRTYSSWTGSVAMTLSTYSRFELTSGTIKNEFSLPSSNFPSNAPSINMNCNSYFKVNLVE